jgi:hypothetical protein
MPITEQGMFKLWLHAQYTSGWCRCLHIFLPSPYSNAVNRLIIQKWKKGKDMWCEFFSTGAMMNRDWTQPNDDLRHLIMCLNYAWITPQDFPIKGLQSI